VVNRKLTVVRNVTMAPRLPRKDALGEIGLTGISSPTDTTVTPMKLEVARTLRIEYIQDISGLCEMSGLVPAASATVNF